MNIIAEAVFNLVAYMACSFLSLWAAFKGASLFLERDNNIIVGMAIDVLGILSGAVAVIALLKLTCFSSFYNLVGNTVYPLSLLVGMWFYFEVEIVAAKERLEEYLSEGEEEEEHQ